MLEIAADAVDPLKEMGAIRITAEAVGDDLELSIANADEPAPGDEVVERDGARVFLDAAAAGALADQTLGIHAHGDHFHFTFEDPAA